MPAKQTGKQRAFQIELDHYKRHDLLWRLKIGLAVAAIVLSAAWWAWGVVRRDDRSYSRGAVSAVHAMWDSNCQVCHQEFSPTNERNWAAKVVGCSISADENCKSCHQGHHKGPTHHATQKTEPSCASCHREHRGRDASLTRLPDSDCTQCHANLPAHTEGGKTSFEPVLTQFTRDHPEFAVLKKKQPDPGRLKFNHELHMMPGLVRQKGDVRALMLARIPANQRERFRQPDQVETEDALNKVQLACAACHQADSSERPVATSLPAAVQRPRGAAAYMQPVVYEQHCQVCHPLTFDSNLPQVAIPHRLQPSDVHRFLWGVYAGETVKDPKLRERLSPERQMPGKDLREDEEKARKAISQKLLTAENFLFQDTVKDRERYLYSGKSACGDCHHYSGWDTDDVLKTKLPKIQPTAVPEVWLTHARFDHAAHRAVDCRQCHARAYADDPSPSSSAADVLIADGIRAADGKRLSGIQLCQQCHSPAHGSGNARVGGARSDCTECHRYHNGDRPLHGLGASERDAGRKLTLHEFLRGKEEKRK